MEIKFKCLRTGQLGIQPVIGEVYAAMIDPGKRIVARGLFVVKTTNNGKTFSYGNISITYEQKDFIDNFGHAAMAALRVMP